MYCTVSLTNHWQTQLRILDNEIHFILPVICPASLKRHPDVGSTGGLGVKSTVFSLTRSELEGLLGSVCNLKYNAREIPRRKGMERQTIEKKKT